ncbi:MAG: hypothetical protein HOC43_03045 [Planctomycetes bacterium]|nr:hypothetical protein [Planctomycetota bacterium]
MKLLLLLAALSPLSMPLVAQEPESTNIEVSSMTHWEKNGELFYELIDLVYQEGVFHIVADRATLRFDAALYKKGLAENNSVASPKPQSNSPLLSQKIQSALFGAMGTVGVDSALLEILLEDNVVINGDGLDLKCSRFSHLVKQEITILSDCDLIFENGAPNGWPMRLLAKELTEFPDGRLEAIEGRNTTCTHEPPHYSISMSRVVREPTTSSGGPELWKPSGMRLRLGGIPVLPLPAFDFSEGESFLGLERIKILSGRAWGASLQADIQGDSQLYGGKLNWALSPAFSSKRGVPLFLDLNYSKENWKSEWSLFALQDQGDDLHGLSSQFGRDSDLRFRARLNNRFQLSQDWRLDADIALTSDPLVDLEFFLQDWMFQDDAETNIHLRNVRQDSFFCADLVSRLDSAGSVPLSYFGSPTFSAQPTLEVLPALRFEQFAVPIAKIPVGALGGKDGLSSLHFSWGATAESLQLRDRGFLAPEANPGYWPPSPTRRLQHLSTWAEFSLPLYWRGLSIRPGFRADTKVWKESTNVFGQDSSLSREAYLDLGVTALRQYEDGWRHHLRPTLRLRDQQLSRSATNPIPQFNGFEYETPGQAVELGFRQSFFAPSQETPWFDLRIQRAWYPDETNVLIDSVFPGPRDGVAIDGWGPTEVQAFWQPRRPGEALRGLSWWGRFRFGPQDVLDESYSQLSIRPNARTTFSFAYRDYLDLYQQATVSSAWRASEMLSFRLSQTFNLIGDAARVNRLSAQYWGHDYIFEVELYLNEINGDEGIFFNFSPRFLAEQHGSMGLPRMASARYLQDTP